MKKLSAISAMAIFLLTMAGCDNELSNGQDDAESEGDAGLQEICDNDIDDDGDGFVDERDPDCQTDADEDGDVAEEEEEEVPPGEICDNGLDDDGDGLVDGRDPDCQEPDADEDMISDPMEDDSVEDVPPEVVEDVVEDTAPDTAEDDATEDAVEDDVVEDSSEDPTEDPTEEDAAEEEPTGIVYSGIATCKWCRDMDEVRPDRMHAETFVKSAGEIMVSDWNDGWETLGSADGDPDFSASGPGLDCIEFTTPPYVLVGAYIKLNEAAFVDYSPDTPLYYGNGSYTVEEGCKTRGTFICRSGYDADDLDALDITHLFVSMPECPDGSCQACNRVCTSLP
ncbi:hypothetical protein KJ969_00850 [Patescibacteria group bacterium]|nr:hypothetical protein [Patescibacteria group bacterium]MBU1921841.1 hypothetical protein [Patescibacteria group bacterium]